MSDQASGEKTAKHLESQLAEHGRKVADLERELANVQGQRNRLQTENSDLSRRLQDSAAQIQVLEKAKLAISLQVEELKVHCVGS